MYRREVLFSIAMYKFGVGASACLGGGGGGGGCLLRRGRGGFGFYVLQGLQGVGLRLRLRLGL